MKKQDGIIDAENKKKKKEKRPHIPYAVQKELWARSAGRCEFRGCNDCLLKDSVTQQTRNTAHIAHIISWQPTGPRGNEIDSPRLAKDITNLMLTCSEHNNTIDDKTLEKEYPVALLRKMKKEHEDRVFWLTDLGQNYSLKVIELVSSIQGQRPIIDDKDKIDAMLPYYPKEESIKIDLTNVESIDEAKRVIDRIVSLQIIDTDDKSSFAAFIMAKIPYSCYLGYAIGNKIKVKTFQFFRDSEDWKWRNSNEHFNIITPEEPETDNINLLINVSGIIDKKLTPDYPTYIIQSQSPGVMFLQSEEQVTEFRIKYREILDLIRNDNGEDVTIHLFVAVPNPISFELGRTIMKNLDPTIILYDKTSDGIEYKEIMHLHNRVR